MRSADRLLRTVRPGRAFLLAFAVFFGLSACWSLASPMFSGPDETSHLVKAAATVRGELTGRRGYVQEEMFQGPSEQPTRSFRVPAAYATQVFPCFAFQVLITPACEQGHAEHPPSKTGSLTMFTTAGHYNPVYYALIGWPSLVFKGVPGMYLLRLASAFLNSLLLAGAVALAASWRRPGFLVAGLVTAATPMVLFLDGVVNPNGLEVTSAVLAWVAALSLAMQPDPAQLQRRVITLVVAATLLVNVRPLGYEWLAAILGVSAFVAAGRGALGAVLRCGTTWRALAAAGPPLAFGLWWTLHNGDDAKVPFVRGNALIPAAHSTLNAIQWHIQCMIAEFGWIDTPAPVVTYDLWIGVTMMLVLAALALGRWRQVLGVSAMGLGVVVIPVLAQGVEAKHIGLVWQGRYLLAFAVGLPLLAGAVLADRADAATLARWVDRRVVLTAATVLTVADLIAFFRALRRYTAGLNGRLLLVHIRWQPPGTWPLWVVLYALVLAASVVCFAGLAVERGAREHPGRATPGVGRPRLPSPSAGVAALRRLRAGDG
jgi:hypothetical protein